MSIYFLAKWYVHSMLLLMARKQILELINKLNALVVCWLRDWYWQYHYIPITTGMYGLKRVSSNNIITNLEIGLPTLEKKHQL